MSNQIRTNETELTTEEEINELNNEKEIETKEPTLRERVFKACDDFDKEGTKITRDLVLSHTGGSCRDLSKYIAEWRQAKAAKVEEETTNTTNTAGALAVQSSSDVVQSQNENNIQTADEVVQTTPINSYNQTHEEAAATAILSALRTKGMILTEEKLVQFFLKNPDQLPEQFKQEIARAKNETNEMLNERSASFEVDFFTKMALSSLQK
jgi:Plasmid replication region DNA-binding N-term